MSAALKIDSMMTPEALLDAVTEGAHKHVCQTQGWMFEEEMKSARLLTANRDLFFSSPATSILWPAEAGRRNEERSLIFNQKFRSSRNKMGLLDDMKTTIAKFTKSVTLIDELASVADEFVTNALFNAPFVDPVTYVNKRVDRMTTMVDLPEEKSGRLFVAEDGKRMLIGVEDPYGSLDVKYFLKRIKECYLTGAALNFGAGGAGIGSYIIFNMSSSLFIGVRRSKATVLGCVVPYRLNRRQRDQLPKHLHWIQP